MDTALAEAAAVREKATAGMSPDELNKFDELMIQDELRRYREMDKLINDRFGGIHPLYGSRAMRPSYDAARDLPMHAYPYRRPEHTMEGAASQQFDFPYHLGTMHTEMPIGGRPMAETERTHRYAAPLEKLTDDDLDMIDRHRHQALKARLEHNGYKLPGEALYPGTKYPLTGAPVFRDLPAGHPLLQPDCKPHLLPAAPELRAGQLLEDSAWLDESEKRQHLCTEYASKAPTGHVWKPQTETEDEWLTRRKEQIDAFMGIKTEAEKVLQKDTLGKSAA